MLQAVLFDLDDTLLQNDVNQFVPQYFKLIAGHLAGRVEPDRLVAALMQGTQAVIQSDDRSRSNAEVFWPVFCEAVGISQPELEPLFEEFYENGFGQLRDFTKPRPEAVSLVQMCLARGLKVVVATNPLFPRVAIEQRLAWANVPVERFDFALVTTFENMYAAKPNVAYYEQILDFIGVAPEQALMVGDNMENDIKPAATLGLATYWVTEEEPTAVPTPQGTMADLLARLEQGWLLESR